MSDREERIRQRAYEKWQKEGEEHGWHDRHWAEAEREIAAEGQSAEGTGNSPSSEADAATPMMDDAGMPGSDEIKSDAGAAASAAAVSGVATGKRRATGGKTAAKKKA
jgi:hypothetical protein